MNVHYLQPLILSRNLKWLSIGWNSLKFYLKISISCWMWRFDTSQISTMLRVCNFQTGFRRICGWCTCKFSWPKCQKMGFTAHHSASYVYPSIIWWGIFFFPFWQRIYGLRFWRHAVSRNSMTSNRNVSETVIFISRMTSTSNFNTLMFVRLYLLLCTTTDCTSKIHIVQYTYVPSNNFFGDMFHLVRATSLFRDSAKVSLARESCARNDVNVSTMLFTVCSWSKTSIRVMEK